MYTGLIEHTFEALCMYVFIIYFNNQNIHTIKLIYIFQCICSQPHRAYQSLQIGLLQAS